MIEEVSAGAVIYNDDPNQQSRRYLILHYPAGHWDFPKGAIEEKETEEQTATREIFEETGLHVRDFVAGFRREIEYHYRRQNMLAHKRVIFFLTKSPITDVRISFEHSGFQWLNFEQAMKRLTFENARSVLHEANEWLSKQESDSA